MSDLWTEASIDHEQLARQASLDLAEAELDVIMPFLLASRGPGEYAHRIALAAERITAIAVRCGAEPEGLLATAERRCQLYREALAEGQDPLGPVADASQGGGYGSGPEQADGHTEGPDFSHGYAEVPQGPLDGPDPQVTQVRPPEAGQVGEATGARVTACSSCGCGTTGKGRCKGCGKKNKCACGPGDPCGGKTAARHTAEDAPAASSTAPGNAMAPPAVPPTATDDSARPLTPPGIGQVTSAKDPVHRQVIAVAASVAAANPGLDSAECRRVARQVVGRYLTADLSSSVMSDDPGGDGGHSGGSGGEGGGTGVAGHMLEWRGLKSMLPSGGGAAGGAADLAELAAL